jgi:hypothetical protein
MIHYKAFEKADDHLWHYCVKSDGRIWPVGYCAQGCPGHETQEGAEEHYKAYLVDSAKHQLEASRPHAAARKCEVCETYTRGLSVTGPSFLEVHALCDTHNNHEGLTQVLEVGESWGS